MVEVLLFHHALGLTPGVVAFADVLRGAGHTVHTPDLFEGALFVDVEAGVAHAQQIGDDELAARAARAADGLGAAIVHAGISLGVPQAQLLAQTRPGSRGVLLFDGCIRPTDLGSPWPPGVPAQIHGMDADPFLLGYDIDAATELAATTPGVELFLYPGDQHLFLDSSTPGHDAAATALLTRRVLGFLERC